MRYAVLAVVAIVASLKGATAAYVHTAQEDTAPVWVCSVMGNRECGPDAPAVIVRGVNS